MATVMRHGYELFRTTTLLGGVAAACSVFFFGKGGALARPASILLTSATMARSSLARPAFVLAASAATSSSPVALPAFPAASSSPPRPFEAAPTTSGSSTSVSALAAPPALSPTAADLSQARPATASPAVTDREQGGEEAPLTPPGEASVAGPGGPATGSAATTDDADMLLPSFDYTASFLSPSPDGTLGADHTGRIHLDLRNLENHPMTGILVDFKALDAIAGLPVSGVVAVANMPALATASVDIPLAADRSLPTDTAEYLLEVHAAGGAFGPPARLSFETRALPVSTTAGASDRIDASASLPVPLSNNNLTNSQVGLTNLPVGPHP